MIRASLLLFAVIAPSIASQTDSKPPAEAGKQPEAPSLQELVKEMKSREGAAKSARLRMRTKGSYPGGMTFSIEGTVRVLGTTHFHVTTVASFEDETRVESETVKTPDGVWMREKDEVNGEVFTKMEPELMRRLEEASVALGEGPPMQAGLGGEGMVPVGSAVLEAMQKTYELAVQPRRIDGEAFYVVAGDARGGVEAEQDGLPIAARVEMLVRQRDLVVKQMSHFDAGGHETMRVEVLELDLGTPLDPASFALKLPSDESVVDVMDHLPAATQINALLERYEESKKRGADVEDEDEDGKGKGAGKGK